MCKDLSLGNLTEDKEIQEINTDLKFVNTQAISLAENTRLLNSIYKMASIYAKSTMIPDSFQNKPENCFVAIELAGRMGVSPTLVMQNLVVVRGKPSWNGQSCIALVNGCGKFVHDLDFIFTGKENEDTFGCYAKTVRKSDGKELIGTEITIKMAKNEGWYSKKDKYGNETSKWQTMTKQMLIYRSASFFARAYCPEVLMGFHTAEEMEDVNNISDKTTINPFENKKGEK